MNDSLQLNDTLNLNETQPQNDPKLHNTDTDTPHTTATDTLYAVPYQIDESDLSQLSPRTPSIHGHVNNNTQNTQNTIFFNTPTSITQNPNSSPLTPKSIDKT